VGKLTCPQFGHCNSLGGQGSPSHLINSKKSF
jgi:hypothetical protein